MKEWFMSREPRERIVLGVGSAVAVLLAFVLLVWRPLQNEAADLEGSVAQKTRLLVDLQRAAAVAPESGGRPQAAGGTQSLLVLVDGTAQSHGLEGALRNARSEGADGISVTLRDASFDAVIRWLVTLQTVHGLSVEAVNVNATRASGLVNGQLSLRRR
jgi:general secretion pathway protein M